MSQGARPRVSVLLPVWNAAAWLAGCLASVARQSFRDFECVIADDGSSDASLAIARTAAAADRRFRVLALPHRGLVATLNAGLDVCRGEFLARIDADDWMHRRRLERQLAALCDGAELAGVGCHVRVFPRSGLGAGMRAYEAWLASIRSAADVSREAFVECPLAHPTLFLRTEQARRLRYREQDWPEDYDLVLRLLASGERLGVVPERLLGWRHHAGRLSQRDRRYAAAAFTRARAHFLTQGFLAGQAHYVLWGFGGTGKALRRELARHGKRAAAIVEVHPGRLGQRIHGAPVIAPAELPRWRHHPLLVSVAGQPNRAHIRRALRRMAFREGSDFLCAA